MVEERNFKKLTLKCHGEDHFGDPAISGNILK
jgi:hypothetical protein